jgi:hypothetical protein
MAYVSAVTAATLVYIADSSQRLEAGPSTRRLCLLRERPVAPASLTRHDAPIPASPVFLVLDELILHTRIRLDGQLPGVASSNGVLQLTLLRPGRYRPFRTN